MTRPEDPKTFSLPTLLMQDVLNYLTSRPYAEVHQLIAAILAHNPQPAPDGDLKPPA